MAITHLFLRDTDGRFENDKREVTLEWLAFSDTMHDYARAVVNQGMVSGNLAGADHRARGWSPLGAPYMLGNDFDDTCYAGQVEIIERKIIEGERDFKFVPDGVGIRIEEIFKGKPVIMWRVRQTFSTDNDPEIDDFPSENDKITVRSSCELEEMPFDIDLETGRPILNSAGERFNPPSLRKRKIPVYSITRREKWNPLPVVIAYTNAVNSDGYFGQLPRTLLMDSINADFDGQLWRVTYNIKEKAEGWDVELLDTGYNWRAPNGLLYPIEDDVGTLISEPAKLNGNGVPLGDQSQLGVNRGPFRRHRLLPFSLLALPNPFNL